ncbi:TRAM domain-containing protein [Halomonas cerina]|uniref:23S rRNA (uracil(1939)-C(5))-methyltransferase RlmD n=1 Tax=Halomonas cerina TaxID=447424 RepID=A0A839VAR2_9GAMM|nr:TRAM domain-containing protein [Halomonas cerina]MBB3191065.1 23S rRNA (uracil1939-C5)-methyltransferase [Halomonas cerina]
MAMLGKRRPPRLRSGVSGLQGRGDARRSQPVAVDEEEGSVEIQSLAHDGRGVARTAAGKTVFVEGALPGERVRIAVHRTRQRFDEAHVRELITSSQERATPPCAHYGTCGGCDLQHLAVPAQRRHKTEVLRELLARQGIALEASLALLHRASEGYRRRARLGVRVDGEGRVHLGFRARHQHRLVDIGDCPVLVPSLSRLLVPLHSLVASLDAPRHVGHLELLESDQGVSLVVRQLREHDADTRRWRAFAEAQGMHLGRWLGREAPAFEWLTQAPALSCRLPAGEQELTLGFAPGDFLQANEAVNREMVSTARTWLTPLPERVLDLFAGVGNFSLPLAAGGARVTAVEGSPAMVERLADNACRNGLDVGARQADLNDPTAIRPLLETVSPGCVVLDPPRSGAEAVCHQLAAHPVAQVLYVACDPATLARDVACLVHGGYRVVRAAVADMFVHTSHLEAMLLLEHPTPVRQHQGASLDG